MTSDGGLLQGGEIHDQGVAGHGGAYLPDDRVRRCDGDANDNYRASRRHLPGVEAGAAPRNLHCIAFLLKERGKPLAHPARAADDPDRKIICFHF
ncbi:MAG: hypothetical protein QG555_848 [Thermodesulfobacteriota bacterium]|nr:hypothetical protein [Thermodesulfobacteriota bacterium]